VLYSRWQCRAMQSNISPTISPPLMSSWGAVKLGMVVRALGEEAFVAEETKRRLKVRAPPREKCECA